jgi:ketosteroid isomerase-like protein
VIPAEKIFRQLLAGIAAGEWSRLPDLYTPDAVVMLPFAKPVPLRLNGRDQIAAHFKNGAAAPFTLRPRNIRILASADAEQIFAEFDYDVVDRRTGRLFTVANVQWIHVRDGLICASRDYHDHAALAAAAAG